MPPPFVHGLHPLFDLLARFPSLPTFDKSLVSSEHWHQDEVGEEAEIDPDEDPKMRRIRCLHQNGYGQVC